MTRLLGNEPYFPREIVLRDLESARCLHYQQRISVAAREGQRDDVLRVGDGLDDLDGARGQAEAHPLVGLYYRSHCIEGLRVRACVGGEWAEKDVAALFQSLAAQQDLRLCAPPNFFTCSGIWGRPSGTHPYVS